MVRTRQFVSLHRSDMQGRLMFAVAGIGTRRHETAQFVAATTLANRSQVEVECVDVSGRRDLLHAPYLLDHW
jgi:hypothetical protein